MKELILLRHAKSSWEYKTDDRNRPLSERGIKRIKKVALESSRVFSSADIIFSSPANRACHTASILINTLDLSFQKMSIIEDLYTFEISQLIKFIKSIPNKYRCVVCVGHNPAFSNGIEYFTSKSFDHLPTSGWAQIKFNQNKWNLVQNGSVNYGMPKDILK